MPLEEYQEWFESWFSRLIRMLKPTASVYICGDWRSSPAIYLVARKYLTVRNRITWEREKGRGSRTNWKNCSEDIWFCTVSDTYTFNVEAVKLKRRVLAPYTDTNQRPRDWSKTSKGNFRLTYPSNLWTDVTVPFWSMPENTDHPTQKPEKLLAKIILASSDIHDMVFDPFVGSGTTSVVAKKLDRRYVGIEVDATYCCLAEKRLAIAEHDHTIQGYTEGVFWERNTLRGT
jgi:site-specific DNA-methyltransferase (adenine-specific)